MAESANTPSGLLLGPLLFASDVRVSGMNRPGQ
ncbi:hypothetical protein FHS54_002934 [Sphingobium vermicomposti]|uniref:Uncharacterized protein n=1 Tax=Sphingobium vermicomposti TaxID=529005 RepID=A0A846MCP6_9SPHN|nr:hypothetical protein [Sphingobium vermicomposti]